MRRVGLQLFLGGLAGIAVGLATEIPLELGFLFGAVAAGIALAARHATGPRVVADGQGVRVLGVAEPIEVPWATMNLGFGIAARSDGQPQRYAVFADGQGRSFAFAHALGGLPCRPVRGANGRMVNVAELRDAPLLLGVIVQRTASWHVFPAALQAAPPPAEVEALPAPDPAADASAPQAAGRKRQPRVGVWGLLLKLGPKITGGLAKVGGAALKAVKTANVAWAAASVAAWSILFSWKFALALMVQLFVHEYGHVHAMRRTGMKVRGMYFVPFLGAMAVTEDTFTSRWQQAYVALNGPLWGSLFALVPAGLWWWTGDASWAAIAAWWALINLFNLLPISPLDGGRLMQAFAFSFSSALGLAVTALGFAGAVAFASVRGLSLLWFVAAIGAMELVTEAQSRQGARALRLLPEPARFGPAHWLYLRAVTGPASGSPGEGFFLRNLDRQRKAASAAPLGPGALAFWGLAYVGLAAVLLLLLSAMGHVPGADAAMHILQ
jgi:Zn-dependent protease